MNALSIMARGISRHATRRPRPMLRALHDGPVIDGVRFCDFVRMPKRSCSWCDRGRRDRWGYAEFVNRSGTVERQTWLSVVGTEACFRCGGRGWHWADACRDGGDVCLSAEQHAQVVALEADTEVPW